MESFQVTRLSNIRGTALCSTNQNEHRGINEHNSIKIIDQAFKRVF